MKVWPQIYACKYSAEVSQLFQGKTLLKSSPLVLSEFPPAGISILQCHWRTDLAESCPESKSCWQASSIPWYGMLYWLLEALGILLKVQKAARAKASCVDRQLGARGQPALPLLPAACTSLWPLQNHSPKEQSGGEGTPSGSIADCLCISKQPPFWGAGGFGGSLQRPNISFGWLGIQMAGLCSCFPSQAITNASRVLSSHTLPLCTGNIYLSGPLLQQPGCWAPPPTPHQGKEGSTQG